MCREAALDIWPDGHSIYKALRYARAAAPGCLKTHPVRPCRVFLNLKFVLAQGFNLLRRWRTCAAIGLNRGFAVSKTTAEKSESKARSGFEREKPMQSFPKGKANSGLSFKSGRFSLSAKIAFGRNKSRCDDGGHAPPSDSIRSFAVSKSRAGKG